MAQQCADTLLPLREELRQHNALSSAVSTLLGQVRKRGLRRTLARKTPATSLPLWRSERGFRLQLGDEVRSIMAAARNYVAQTIAFPQDLPVEVREQLELVDEAGIRAHLQQRLPVDSLLDWLRTHYGKLADTTLLRLFHELQHEAGWECEAAPEVKATELQTVRVLHHPHRMPSLPQPSETPRHSGRRPSRRSSRP